MKTLAPLFTWRSAICDSDLPPTARHIALTLSLHMNERGGSCFPGAVLLAHETGLSERAVREHLGRLVDNGWLTLRRRGGMRGDRRMANEYVASTPEPAAPVDDATPEPERAAPLQEVPDTPAGGSPQLSIEGVTTEVSTNASTPPPRVDPVFEALAESCGIDWHNLTATARGALNRAVRELKTVDATPDEIHLRTRRFLGRYKGATPTPMALAKHWPQLGIAQPEAPASEPKGLANLRDFVGQA